MKKIYLPAWLKRRPLNLFLSLTTWLITGSLLVIYINSLMPGVNRFEETAINSLKSFNWLPTEQSLNYPYYLIAKILSLRFDPLLALRLTSVTFGLLTVLSLSYTAKKWLNQKMGLISILIVATSYWFLVVTRTGAPIIMNAFWIASILSLGTWRTLTAKPKLANLAFVSCFALSLYTPYNIWLVLIGLIIYIVRHKKQTLKNILAGKKYHYLLALIAAIIVAPLIFTTLKSSSQLTTLLGLNNVHLNTLTFGKNLINGLLQVFIFNNNNQILNVGNLPLLDIFSATMALLGLSYFMFNILLRRSQIVIGFLVLFNMLLALSKTSEEYLSILMPIYLILVISGTQEMLSRWLSAFPRNPLARSVGIILLTATISFASFYNLQKYFVAWAKNPEITNAHKR